MKHDRNITLLLMILFMTAQVIGLFIFSRSMHVTQVVNETTGMTKTVLVDSDIPGGRPDTVGADAFFFVVFALLFGTALVFLIIKFKFFKLWKGWFFLAIAMTIGISLSVFIDYYIALVLGVVLASLKLFKPNIFTHNISEIFMYSGIVIMLAPIFGEPTTQVVLPFINYVVPIPENMFWLFMMLGAVSLYDAIAVWKSKHMITMAKAQAKNKMFAGLMIPYGKASPESKKTKVHVSIPKGMKKKNVTSAILGGGDIAFPMLFAGGTMRQLILLDGLSIDAAFLKVLIIPVVVGAALYMLLIKGKKDTFYPAMPFISVGCILGYVVLAFI